MTNAKIQVLTVAQAHGWVIEPLTHGKIWFASGTGRTRLTAKFDATGRLRKLAVRRPLPPKDGGGVETFEVTSHRLVTLLRMLRGEHAPHPIEVSTTAGDDLTELELDVLSDEAEAGYDVNEIRPRNR